MPEHLPPTGADNVALAGLWPYKIVSIHMQSNRPSEFVQFLDRIEASADHPEDIEVIVKIDDTDRPMNELLDAEVKRRRCTLKFISTPLPDGFYGLWRSMNDLLHVADPQAYFVINLNDEMWFATKGWDSLLRRRVGLFPDHIFRLRTSVLNRHRNYHDVWQCGFAPDTSAFITQKWLRLCGDWTPCTGPETFQQCVAYFLSYHQRFSQNASCRDVAIDDIVVQGEGANGNVSDYRALRLRHSGAVKQWFILMSHRMQQKASQRAQLLRAHIFVAERQLTDVSIRERRGSIEVVADGRVIRQYDFRLSRLRIGLTNFLRFFNYHFYGGGGDEIGHNTLWNTYSVIRLLIEGTDIYGYYWKLSHEPRPNNPTVRDYLIRGTILALVIIPRAITRRLAAAHHRPDH